MDWTRDNEARSHAATTDKLIAAKARIHKLESAMRQAAKVIDTNLYHQREKVTDASALLRQALEQD